MTTYISSLTIPSFILEKPAASILLPIALGTAVGFSTRPDRTRNTYRTIKNPPGHPPPAAFGPVWTVLYGCMGYAAYRVWTTGMNVFDAKTTLLAKQGATLYSIQLGLNLLWMPLFFGLGRPIEATADIVTLTGLNAYLTYIYSKVDPVAAWLQMPYVAWLSYATYLSAGAGYLNDWSFEGKELGSKDD
ncbi:TspO/MBR-related protein [Patellaria atrata CBS 101060]|uniref:TspO/MBR-related protein n=1 Tax=Patellaria atrata CBS 101060 TaxID=1346257 RepID=A0A9P4S5F3_9PEZI|nr:TspO/MBR-related protein [Patellaria atrata CBS 101060]